MVLERLIEWFCLAAIAALALAVAELAYALLK